MQTAEKKSEQYLRRFKVGIVGASQAEINIISRIFTVTHCRSRSYELVRMDKSNPDVPDDVDFVILCSSNPIVIAGWRRLRAKSAHQALSHPFVYLTHSQAATLGAYQMVSPINPTKLIRLLDGFTIKEMNFFPEFEIGHDSTEVKGITISGIKMLKAASDRAASTKTNRTRALVVDDSLAVRKQMEIEFSLLDNDLDVVASAEEALSAVSETKYDVIFLDVVMPGMDGYTACKKMKRQDLNKETPVILLTSRSSSFDKIKGALAGCDAYLVKPINHNEFNTVYKKFVNSSHKEIQHVGQ